MNSNVYPVAVAVQVNRLESCPDSMQELVSPVSVSMMDTLSTEVSPSFTVGDVSCGVYTGVWSLTSVRPTVKVSSAVELSALVASTVNVHDADVSKSRAVGSPTETIPVPESIENAPAHDWAVMA